MKSQKVILLLGGNRGDVYRHFVESARLIDKEIGNIYSISRIYTTKAWGPIPQPDFLNMAIGVHTAFPPACLLKRLLEIEKKFGRIRDIKFGPRTLDIDILFYGSRVIKNDGLMIPHKELHKRRFVLVPCCEIAAGFIHPQLKKTLKELLSKCDDKLDVTLWKR